MEQRTLDTIATEVKGISSTLTIIGISLDPDEGGRINPEVYQTSLFALSEHLDRIQTELEAAHMRLEVRP